MCLVFSYSSASFSSSSGYVPGGARLSDMEVQLRTMGAKIVAPVVTQAPLDGGDCSEAILALQQLLCIQDSWSQAEVHVHRFALGISGDCS